MFKRSIFIFILFPFLLCSGCSFAQNGKEALSVDSQGSFAGWNLVANRLIADGISPELVAKVLQSVPPFEFIPFKIKPVESPSIYNRMTDPARIDRAAQALKNYSTTFEQAEKKFGVTKYALAAIISVETNWGTFTGDHIVVYRLMRIASTLDPTNVILNNRKHQQEDPSISLQQSQDRAQYLFDTFYPQILALFRLYKDQPQKILQIKGSIAGAFGLPQFLPLSFESYALDGNANNNIDLLEPEDAIMSVASYLRAKGWRKLMPPQEKLKVLWHYNKSDAYGRAIIKVALNLQSRELR